MQKLECLSCLLLIIAALLQDILGFIGPTNLPELASRADPLLATGREVPLVMFQNGMPSNTVTVAVQ